MVPLRLALLVLFVMIVGGCEVHTHMLVSVSPPISTEKFGHYEALCEGEGTTIGVQAAGGNGNNLSYVWNPNISSFSMQEIYPDSSTTYYITTWDGCSSPVTDTIFVFVKQPFSAVFQTSDTLCYGTMG